MNTLKPLGIAIVIVAVLILFVLVSTGKAAPLTGEVSFVDTVEETRGFTNAAGGSKCSHWKATGTASVGDRVCADAYFRQGGDAIIRYQRYKMPVNGWLKFCVHRNDHNQGWAWTFIATIRKRDGSFIIRKANTGLTGQVGRVALWRGERLLRTEFRASDSAGAVPEAHIRMLRVWTTTR